MNEAVFSIADIAKVTSGTLVREGPPVVGIVADAHDVRPGVAFLPVKSNAYDLARCVAEAALAGASAYVLERVLSCPPGRGVVMVKSTTDALAALGREHRRRWGRLSGVQRVLVGVTGSSGKSSTARLVAALLEVAEGATLYPSKRHAATSDSRSALSCDLFDLGAEHRHAVFELATRQRGDVARLAATCEPDVGLVTLIGHAHAEGVGSIDDAADEKGELLAAVPVEGVVGVNHDDARARRTLATSRARRSFSWGYDAGAPYRVLGRTPLGLDGSRLSLETPHTRFDLHTAAIGRSGALAVAAAVGAVETLLGRALTRDEAQSALDRAALTREPRLVAAELESRTIVLEDRTDPTPSSLRAAIEAALELAQTRATRLVLVLGDMRELGRGTAREHGALGALAASLGAAAMITVGNGARHAAIEALARGVEVWAVPDVPAAVHRAHLVVRPSDVVLVAGGPALGAVARAIVAGSPAQPGSSRVDTP